MRNELRPFVELKGGELVLEEQAILKQAGHDGSRVLRTLSERFASEVPWLANSRPRALLVATKRVPADLEQMRAVGVRPSPRVQRLA